MITKGAPEVIVQQCVQNSVPPQFSMMLEAYEKTGLRIIAMAEKEIASQDVDLSEDELESEMVFKGFIFFQNPLKEETLPTLNTLRQAEIQCLMITGDSMFTALNVAFNCNMIQSSSNVLCAELNEE